MAYRTVLVHLDSDAQCARRVAAGAALLGRDGLLAGVAVSGVSRLLYPAVAPEGDAYLALHLAFLRERAEAALAAFRTQAAQLGLAHHEGRLVDDEAGGGLSLHARVADVVVLSQGSLAPDMVPHVLLHAARPVLVLPATSAPVPPVIGRRVLAAWDAGREAARALAGALPLLKRAARVDLVVCDTQADGRAASEAALADPVAWLARHGVAATLQVHLLEGRRGRMARDAVGEALLSLAADCGADLLVMGAYAHSRMRETILGGVTRTVLSQMTLPVLMEH